MTKQVVLQAVPNMQVQSMLQQAPVSMQQTPGVQEPGMQTLVMVPQQVPTTTTEPTTTTPEPTTTKTITTTLPPIPHDNLGLSWAVVDFYNTSFFRQEEVRAVMFGDWGKISDIVVGGGWSSDWADILSDVHCAHYGGVFDAFKSECDKIMTKADRLKKAGFVIGRVAGHCEASTSNTQLTWQESVCGKHDDGFCGGMGDTIQKLSDLEDYSRQHVKEIFYMGSEKGWFTSVTPSNSKPYEELRDLLAGAGLGKHFLTNHMALNADNGIHTQLTQLLQNCERFYGGIERMKNALAEKYTSACEEEEEQKWQLQVQSRGGVALPEPNNRLMAAVVLCVAGAALVLLALRSFRSTVVNPHETENLLELQTDV